MVIYGKLANTWRLYVKGLFGSFPWYREMQFHVKKHKFWVFQTFSRNRLFCFGSHIKNGGKPMYLFFLCLVRIEKKENFCKQSREGKKSDVAEFSSISLGWGRKSEREKNLSWRRFQQSFPSSIRANQSDTKKWTETKKLTWRAKNLTWRGFLSFPPLIIANQTAP